MSVCTLLRNKLLALTILALTFCLPGSLRANDDDDDTPPSPVQFAGLELVYSDGQSVAGQVNIIPDPAWVSGQLTLDAYDQAACLNIEPPCPTLFHQAFSVSLAGSSSSALSFQLPPLPVGVYGVRASLTAHAESDPSKPSTTITVPPVTFRFGIRAAGMENVPNHILRAVLENLPVETMEAALAASAESGVPTQMQLGSHTYTVSVQQQSILGNGVSIPGIDSISAYAGTLMTPFGYPQYDSTVNFLFINGQLSAKVSERADGDPSTPTINETMVDPMSDYQVGAAANLHVIYVNKDTVPTDDTGPKLHLDPIADTTAVVAQSIALGAGLIQPQAAVTDTTYVIPVSVYVHPASFPISDSGRVRITHRAMQQYVNEFQKIPLRYNSSKSVSVAAYTISSWRSISTSGYGSKCSNNLSQFQVGTADPGIINVLFTQYGDDCGGIAYRPGSSYYGPHALVADGGSVQFNYLLDPEFYRSVVLLQEIGHTLDYYPYGYPSYDAHRGAEISESWYDNWFDSLFGLNSCTAMRGSYDCAYPAARYHNSGNGVLTTLAHGIDRYIAPAEVAVRVNIGGQMRGAVKDIAVGPSDAVWAITADSRIWKRRFNANTADSASLWDLAAGLAERIAVEPSGVPWVVNSAGGIYRKASADPADSAYQQMPGVARDIAVGADGSVWHIGSTPVSGNSDYGVFKWNANTKVWEQLTIVSGVRIAVDPLGNPWVVRSNGDIVACDIAAHTTTTLPGKAFDIAIAGTPSSFRVGLIGGTSPAGIGFVSYQSDQGKLKTMPHWVPQVQTPLNTFVNGVFGPSVGLGMDSSKHLWEAINNGSTAASFYYTTNPNR